MDSETEHVLTNPGLPVVLVPHKLGVERVPVGVVDGGPRLTRDLGELLSVAGADLKEAVIVGPGYGARIQIALADGDFDGFRSQFRPENLVDDVLGLLDHPGRRRPY